MKRISLMLIAAVMLASSLSAQWKKVYGGTTNSFIINEIIQHNNYFFASTNGPLLRSSDKGETWEVLSTFFSPIHFNLSIETDGSRLYLGLNTGNRPTILYSDDNGATWIPSNITHPQISKIKVVNSNLVYAYSNFQMFFKSTDRGETWTEWINLPFNVTYTMFVSSTGRLFINNYYSDDNGETWTKNSLNGMVNGYSENELGLWAGTDRILFSGDNGITWQEKKYGNTTSVIGAGNNVFRGTFGFEYSTDGGKSFVEYNEGIEKVTQIISMAYDGEIILIGLNGPGIYKIDASKLGITTSVEKHKEISKDFQLMQNYPNPFNPETIINYKLSAVNSVDLRVYDILGKEVAILVNEVQQPGMYNVKFTIRQLTHNRDKNSSLSTGIYFYKLQAGDFVQTKKMMFIK
jgi:photosystem II stability/assembly factor-like uncharacterized protein